MLTYNNNNAQVSFLVPPPLYVPFPSVPTPTAELPRAKPLWVTKIKQINKLEGKYGQSLLTRHFYPRSFGYGNLQITGIAGSSLDPTSNEMIDGQQTYQNLAQFIREHQTTLVSQLDLFNNYLMNLQIFAEGIYVRGFVDKFTLTKRGVFEPAPEYNFEFIIVHWDERDDDWNIPDSIGKQKNWFPTKNTVDILPFRSADQTQSTDFSKFPH